MGTKNIDDNTLLQRIAEGGFKSGGAAWSTGATAQDLRLMSDVEMQVAGLVAGDAITVTRSIDGVNYAPVAWLDGVNGNGTTISVDQIYSFPGNGYLKWAKTGGGAAPTVTLRAAS